MENRRESIQRQKILLEKNNAVDIGTYIKKLEENINSELHFEDLLFEGKVALLFLKHGFKVQMRESPDLRLSINNFQIYAEVKHFREKKQDIIDNKNMKEAKDEAVIIGDTLALEGFTPWEQVFNVAKKKTKQYIKGSPNILVVGSSSSNCIDYSIFSTVINIISEHKEKKEFGSLSGIMLLSRDTRAFDWRNVFFFPTVWPEIELDASMFHNIKSH